MNSKSKKNIGSSMLDPIAWIVIVLLISGSVVANFYFATYPLPMRLIGWAIIAIVTAVVALQTSLGKNIWNFIKLSRMELRKVVWPKRQETVQTTLVVIAMVTIMSLLLWGIDTLLLWVIGILTGQTG